MIKQINEKGVVGIIAGSGILPLVLANNFTRQDRQCYIAVLSEKVDLSLYKNFSYQFFKIGMVGAIIKYFRTYHVKGIILAGGINRVNLNSIKVDLTGSILLARILKHKFLGDDKILRVVNAFLKEKGFNILSSDEMLNGTKDIITEKSPSTKDLIDIELGVKLLNSISMLDVGQAVIVEDGYIIGIEAAEGTDNLIERGAALRKKSTGAVLVKIMKRGQDIRVDMPTIGPETIHNLAKYKYQGIAIEKNKVIIIDPSLIKELANKYGLFIYLI